MRLVAAAFVLCLTTPLAADDRPLPELNAFLTAARARLATDHRLQSQYTYLERRHELKLTKLGKLTTGSVELFQVYPGDGDIRTYRRLIEVDGKPLPPAELDKEDRERQKRVLDTIARRERETAADREKRRQHREQEQREEQETIDDLFRVFDFRMSGRQIVGGRPVIAIDFSPRSGAAPKTDVGKLMRKAKGRALVSEDDFQIARVDVEMLDDVSVGLGLLGKLYKGTTASFERRKVNNEVWLPAEARFNGSGRALVRRFQIDTVVEFSDYRKFSVETDTTFAMPKKP